MADQLVYAIEYEMSNNSNRIPAWTNIPVPSSGGRPSHHLARPL